MNHRKNILFIVALLLMIGIGAVLVQLRVHQKLGQPGVRTSPIADSIRLQVDLPTQVLDYNSEPIEVQKMVLDFLPKDTSFGQRFYKAPDGFTVQVNVVLMGTDRTSLHKPQFCLGGMGWQIDESASRETTIPLEKPRPYDLPVMKLVASKDVHQNGQTFKARGVYVYWFVADNQVTASHNQRMWWMAKDMLRTGVLQRWAYVTYFSTCLPGQEEAAFERMKKMIAASVPQFQLTPGPVSATASTP